MEASMPMPFARFVRMSARHVPRNVKNTIWIIAGYVPQLVEIALKNA
jgi:hypothetical protein